MKAGLLLLALGLPMAPALGQCGAPSLHGDGAPDLNGLSRYSVPVRLDTAFNAGVTLHAEARNALAQTLDSAGRLHGGQKVCAVHAPGPAADRRHTLRLDYLRGWLALRDVELRVAQHPWCASANKPLRDVIELLLMPCSA